jgi:hypothetical protein
MFSGEERPAQLSTPRLADANADDHAGHEETDRSPDRQTESYPCPRQPSVSANKKCT